MAESWCQAEWLRPSEWWRLGDPRHSGVRDPSGTVLAGRMGLFGLMGLGVQEPRGMVLFCRTVETRSWQHGGVRGEE